MCPFEIGFSHSTRRLEIHPSPCVHQRSRHFYCQIVIHGWMNHGLTIHQGKTSVGGFQVLATMNIAAMNVCVQVVCGRKFQFLWNKC